MALTRLPAEVYSLLKFMTDTTLSSDRDLQEIQLTAMSKAANYEREMRELLRLWLSEQHKVDLAIWLREHRHELIEMLASLPAIQDK